MVNPPSGAFYIQSWIGQSDWVLSSWSSNRGTIARLAHKSGWLNELWRAEPDPRGGFFLFSLAHGEVLKTNGLQGREVSLVPRTFDDPQQLWRIDEFGGDGRTRFLLTTQIDWQQKLNVAGRGPWNDQNAIIVWEYSGGQPNEVWSFIADGGEFMVDSIEYDIPNATLDLNVPAREGPEVWVPNQDKVKLSTEIELVYKRSSTRSYSYTQPAMEAAIACLNPKGMPAPNYVGFNETTKPVMINSPEPSFGTRNPTSEEEEYVLTVGVNVPAGCVYEFRIRTQMARIAVPYFARLARNTPLGRTSQDAVRGLLTNVSTTSFVVTVRDVTKGRTMDKAIEALDAVILRRIRRR